MGGQFSFIVVHLSVRCLKNKGGGGGRSPNIWGGGGLCVCVVVVVAVVVALLKSAFCCCCCCCFVGLFVFNLLCVWIFHCVQCYYNYKVFF